MTEKLNEIKDTAKVVANDIKDFIDVNISEQSPSAKRTLYGVVLLKIGTAGVATWGNLNLYYFSYFKKQDPLLEYGQLQFMISLVGLTSTLCAILSVVLGKKISYSAIVKIVAITYPLTCIRASYCEDFQCFKVYGILLSGSLFGLGLMPVLYCLWSYYPKDSGKVTGIIMAAFGLATIAYSIIGTWVVNPDNISPAITHPLNKQIHYFGDEVTKNHQKMMFTLSIIYTGFCFIGGLLISEGDLKHMSDAVDEKKNGSDSQKQGDQELSSFNQNQNLIQKLNQNTSDNKSYPTFTQGLISAPFLIIWFSTFILSLYALFLSLNYKAYGFTKLDNDHMLTFIYTGALILASIFSLYFGTTFDQISYRKMFIFIFLVCGIFGVTFPIAGSNTFLFAIWFAIITSIERGVYTIVGPTLIQIFGLKTGSDLFPFKIASFLLALVVIPILQYLAYIEGYSFDSLIYLLGLLVLLCYFLIIQLKDKYVW